MTSTSFEHRAAKLLIDPYHLIGNHSGTWFIMRIDWYVLSIIQFSLRNYRVDDEGDGSTFRNMNFFTVGITALYQSDDDVKKNIEENSGNKNEHYFGVSDIADEVERAHGKNLSRALYLALRNSENSPATFTRDDISHALQFCSFEEVLQLPVSLDDLSMQLGSQVETMTGRKLLEVIQSLLRTIPGSSDDIFYFYVQDMPHINEFDQDGVTSTPFDLHEVQDEFSGGHGENEFVNGNPAIDIVSYVDEIDPKRDKQEYEPPIFFRFTLDGKTASVQDILGLKRSVILTAEVSVFKKSERFSLPSLHTRVISQLRRALNSFSSEQVLEKYRFFGDSLSDDDYKIILRNMPLTKHYAFETPLVFFVSRSESLISASNPTGSSENELDYGFSVLTTELDRHKNTIKAIDDAYLVLDDTSCRNVFPFWCFVQVRKDRGSAIIRVYHPGGDSAAAFQGEVACKLVESIGHRTNQLLLLESLYKTKNASNLLIPETEVSTDGITSKHSDGSFSCPIQHRVPMLLNHRVAPNQAILALDSTVLQNFLVSNRRGIFAYKDESDNVFYMTLRHYKTPETEDGEHNPNIVELQVHGLTKPGPSITDQLARLLQKKLLLLPLDALSTVLKKNPYYQLLPADVAFLTQFQSAWKSLEQDIDAMSECSTKVYELPVQMQDPIMLLLMFRQNISGSTFIQHLHESTEDKSARSTDIMQKELNGCYKIQFLPKEFLFYFNSSPSQLDPNYQPLTTLTEKGRLFSRQAGSGIAIIHINLLRSNGEEVGQIHTGETGPAITNLHASKSDISLIDVTDEKTLGSGESFRISVKIINTTVDVDVLHKWVHLSLSQVLVAWNVERHLKWHKSNSTKRETPHCLNQEQQKMNSIEKSMPGLPALMDMLNIGVELPHPTIIKVCSDKMIRSTLLASTLLAHLSVVLCAIFNQKAISFPIDDVHIIRYTDYQKAIKVTMCSDNTKGNGVRVVSTKKKKNLKDKPTDNPEYFCVFGLGKRGEQRPHRVQASQLFFQDINAGRPASEESAFSQALMAIKKSNPSLFERGLAFVLTVSRRRRSLITFNVNPQILASMKTKFMEIEEENVELDDLCRSSLRNRSLPFISGNHPTRNEQVKEQVARRPIDLNPTKHRENTPVKGTDREGGAPRRIPRPKSMLRPKLIGKSVEGSAMQAVAASRLRASVRPTPAQRNVSSGGQKSSNGVPTKPKAERKAPSAQRTPRISVVSKDSSSGALSAANPPASRATQLKIYRDFITTLKEGPEYLISLPRLNQSSLQLLLHIFLSTMKPRPASLMSLRLMATCYGNPLKTVRVEQLRCDREESAANALFDFVTKRWYTRNNIVPMGDAACKPGQKKEPSVLCMMYFKKDLVANSSRRSTLVMEFHVSWNYFTESFVFTCKLWIVSSTEKSNKASSSTPLPTARQFMSFGSVERECGLTDAAALDFFNKLHLESEVFNFSGFRLVQAARKRCININTLSLLRDIIVRFHWNKQELLPCLEYRLQRKYLSLESFLKGPLLISSRKESIIEFLTNNCNDYNLVECSGSGAKCFSGRLTTEGFPVYYFIAWHESMQSSLDIFVLIVTKGRFVDAHITKEGSPFAEQIADVILYSSMIEVQALITKACKEIRKQHLWDILGKQYSFQSATNLSRTINELRDVSHHVDIMSLNTRIGKILSDKLYDFRIPWREVLLSTRNSKSFMHCIDFSLVDPRNYNISNYIIFCGEHDAFLDFRLNESDEIIEAELLIYHGISAQEYLVKNVINDFTTFLLQWIWNDTQAGL